MAAAGFHPATLAVTEAALKAAAGRIACPTSIGKDG
jgi:hypothetical protein